MKEKASKNITFNKNDLLFHFARQDFPSHLIEKEINNSVHDFLFSEETQEPEPRKRVKLGNSFFIEDELEPRKNFKGKKPYQNQNQINKNYGQNQNQNPPIESWRRTEPEDPGFFDDFKGKSDAKQVFAFKRNLELAESRELDIMINKTVMLDFKDKEEKDFFNVDGKKKNGMKANWQFLLFILYFISIYLIFIRTQRNQRVSR